MAMNWFIKYQNYCNCLQSLLLAKIASLAHYYSETHESKILLAKQH